MQRVKTFFRSFLEPERLLPLSFAALILAGACLLVLPGSTTEGTRIHFIDALFTSASAVCVTGLTLLDTGQVFSLFGQGVVLVLIQVGGLGMLTFTNLIILLRQGRLGFSERQVLEQSHGLLPNVSPSQLLKMVFLYTCLVEMTGASILYLQFHFSYGMPHTVALWQGVFHAISAFCNAGFGLKTNNLMDYHRDVIVSGTIMGLIVMGGLGFVVVTDVALWLRARLRRTRTMLALHSRVVIRTTFLLILIGALLVLALEHNNTALTGPFWERLMESFFVSVTARTAGFNTTDTSQLTNATLLIVILLMAIGASPGSTGGGMKTTTLATLFAVLYSRGRNRPRVELMERSLSVETQAKAFATTAGFFLVTIIAMILLQVTELYHLSPTAHRGDFLKQLFEVVSALGTVGLSTGITADLSTGGKLVIIACMYIGRCGPAMLAASVLGKQPRVNYSYPQEDILIG